MEHKINGNTVTVDLRPKQLTKEEAEKHLRHMKKKKSEGKEVIKTKLLN